MLDVLFVTPTEKAGLRYEVNGTMLLATRLLQADFTVDLVHFWMVPEFNKDYDGFIRNMTRKILEHEPKSVAFYTLWPTYHIMLRIASELKRNSPQIHIVMGGPQASATAQPTMEAMPFVDYVCTGEGENTVVPFFQSLLRQEGAGMDQIPGLYYRCGSEVMHNDMDIPLCDLNEEPYWDPRLYTGRYEENPKSLASNTYYMPLDVGRGCPFSCTFCSSSRFWRRTYRMKSPERIVADMRYYIENFGIRSFAFTHDAFTVNRKLVEKVCDHMLEQKLDVRWRCTTRIDCITEELILKMKQTGLQMIEVGVETGSERMQKITNKRLKLDDVRHKIDFMQKNGMKVVPFFMYGFPEETEEDLNQTLELMLDLLDRDAGLSSFGYTSFNPGSAITEQYMDELVFDPSNQIQSRGIFGYENEQQLFADNKRIFPFFYHLNTHVRNNYQYINFFGHLYGSFRSACRYLRKFYAGDNLRFYREFCEVNKEIFAGGMDYTTEFIREQSWKMMDNLLEKIDPAYVPMLRGLLRYDYNHKRVSDSKKDISIEETYDFVIIDLQKKRPIELFSPGRTKLLIQKTNGIKKATILDIQMG